MCEICQLPDCGNCTSCRERGKGSKKSNAHACVKRKCPYMAIQEVDDSDPDDEEFYQKTAEEKAKQDVKSRQVRTSGGKKEVKWIGQPVHQDERKIYYRYTFSLPTLLKLEFTYYFRNGISLFI